MTREEKIGAVIVLIVAIALVFEAHRAMSFDARCSQANGSVWQGPGGESACLIDVRRIDP